MYFSSIQMTPALFEQASSPDRMILLSVEAIRAIIRPCGLSPQKSKAIHRLSQILLDLYDGEVPADMAALEQLPGVGHKTASVVMAQAFGLPTFPVDTHIHRLAQRWGRERKPEREFKNECQTTHNNTLKQEGSHETSSGV